MITPLPDTSSTETSTDYAGAARACRAAYESELAAIRSRANVTHHAATRVELARARTRAEGQLRLLEEADTRQRVLRAAAEAPVWRSGDALAGRDARDRADRITSADSAANAINDAARAGDDDLVKELAYQAVRRGADDAASDWAQLGEDYLRQTGLYDSMRKTALGHGHAAELAAARGVFWPGPAPDELRGMADFEIHSLASRDPGEAVARATRPQRDAWAEANRRSGQSGTTSPYERAL